jgi:hypothetical protein
MTKRTHFTRSLAALALCLATLVTTPATASATPPVAETPAKAKLHAQLLDTKVKVNAKARIHGRLDLDTRSTLWEPIIVQRLVAGVWVDVFSTECRPNYTFRLGVSFSISTQYTLRVYNPTLAVHSSTFLLTVL